MKWSDYIDPKMLLKIYILLIYWFSDYQRSYNINVINLLFKRTENKLKIIENKLTSFYTKHNYTTQNLLMVTFTMSCRHLIGSLDVWYISVGN